MQLAVHYADPRLVALYDAANPGGADHEFYRGLADEVRAGVVVDLGCGTGLLTRTLVRPGRVVVGVDPAREMLAVARARPGAEHVRWIQGVAAHIPPDLGGVDLVTMTGNVAQVFCDDAEWSATLDAIAERLRPGGWLSFETRNPAARAWERWTREGTWTQTDTDGGPLREWLENVAWHDGVVTFEGHNHWVGTGEHLVGQDRLRFRTREEIAGSLAAAGLAVRHCFGDWSRGPVTDGSAALVFVAQRS